MYICICVYMCTRFEIGYRFFCLNTHLPENYLNTFQHPSKHLPVISPKYPSIVETRLMRVREREALQGSLYPKEVCSRHIRNVTVAS